MDWRWRKKRFETAFMRTLLTGGLGIYGMGIVLGLIMESIDDRERIHLIMLVMATGLILTALSVGCLTFIGFPPEKEDKDA